MKTLLTLPKEKALHKTNVRNLEYLMSDIFVSMVRQEKSGKSF